MDTPKELTTKEKILRSLEEGDRRTYMLGSLVGGFMAIHIASTLLPLWGGLNKKDL